MATTRVSGDRVDYGRLIVISFASVMLGLDILVLSRAGPVTNLRWAGTLLTGIFYALIMWCYLRRGPAIATSGSTTAHVAAVLATVAPFAIPLVSRHSNDPVRQLTANVLLLIGTGWAVWSLRYLGRNLSVLAQARDLVDSGPYRWIRHPLYTGEIVSSAGLTVTAWTVPAAAIWFIIVGLQVYRAVREEELLEAILPRYRDYQRRTGAIVPAPRRVTRR